MSRGRRGQAREELWSGAGRRALGYIRLRDARGIGLPRELETLERLCHEHGTTLADVAVEVAPAGAAGTPPGLAWALARLASGEATTFAVRRLDDLTGPFADRGQAARWLGERRVLLISGEQAAEAHAPRTALRIGRGILRSPGVDPPSWARYLQARTHARLRNC